MSLHSFILAGIACVLVIAMHATAQPQPEVGGAAFGLEATVDGRIVVNRVAPGGPAERAGIRVGDVLLAVGGQSVRELTGTQLVDAIRGPVGSEVELVYSRDGGDPTAVTITRAALGAPPPAGHGPPPIPPRGQDGPRNPLAKPGNPLAKPNAAPPVPPVAGEAMTFTQQSFRDPAAQNCVAVTYLVPKGWQAQGAIEWWHTYQVLAQIQLKMTDPQTGTAIEFLPLQKFAWSDQLQGLIQVGQNWLGSYTMPPVGDPVEFVQRTWATTGVLGHLRGLQPVAKEQYPQLALEAVKNDQGWTAQAVRLRYEFDNGQGKPWEQDVYFTLAYAPANNGGVAFWNVQRAYTASAPRGLLDGQAAVIKATVANVSATPQWLATYTVCQQLFTQGMKQSVADAAALGRSIQEYNAHIQKLSQQMHEDRMKSFDRIAASQREYLGGVETYTDPYEGRGVYMPAGYKAYWVNQKGEMVLSEQETFNPNHGDTNDWRRMERRDPTQ
jgi:hypothetical protein